MYDRKKFLEKIPSASTKTMIELLWDKQEVGKDGLLSYVAAFRESKGYRKSVSVSKHELKWLERIGFLRIENGIVLLNPAFIPKDQRTILSRSGLR